MYQKSIWQNTAPIHDKKKKETRNRGKYFQLDEDYLHKLLY